MRRQYVTSDTNLKSVTNPNWAHLTPHARAGHDELERLSGLNVTGGRIRLAKQFSNRDWQRMALTTKGIIEEMVTAGWATWDGEDLVLVGYDLRGEEIFIRQYNINRKRAELRWTRTFEAIQRLVAEAESKGEESRRPPQQAEKHPKSNRKTSRQLASSRHFVDASASASAAAAAAAAAAASADQIHPPTQPKAGRANGRVDGWATLSPGARKVWASYPEEKTSRLNKLAFKQCWEDRHFELHAEWVEKKLIRMRSSKKWAIDGYIPEPKNFLLELGDEDKSPRPYIEDCPCGTCVRTRAARPKSKSGEPIKARESKPAATAAAAPPPNGGWRQHAKEKTKEKKAKERPRDQKPTATGEIVSNLLDQLGAPT